MRGQIGKIFLFGIPLILIVVIGILLFALNRPLSVQTKTGNTRISTNPSDNLNINSTPVSTTNTLGFPQIIYKSVQIPYGLSLPQALGVNFFTGVVSKATVTNETLTVDVSNPTTSKIYTFHFPKFTGIAEMTDPNQLQVVLVSTSANEAVKKLTIGKYFSIKFDASVKFNSISDMVNNESGTNKSIIIYNFVR